MHYLFPLPKDKSRPSDIRHMSSQDASQRSETRDQQIEPCPMGLSFIVHSTDALPMGLSSHVDDKQSLSRQKRRRTRYEIIDSLVVII